ncbi:MFS transporter [Oceanobacillus piezotolerans]|uniref:MFS transporter n=1 Tax=Oceanobacillus piezotolerans TaxID=2448030 RepID=A0A498D376_9BACI|nr:MFS transporter [Oceanobacillus piezotolerans]RLL40363.1 MFS transporter [Oceanobacillus piezotolerans]
MVSANTRFWILILLVAISGFSQGMLMPLLSIILEQNGVPSSINGLHATGLYIGVLVASFFMEKPLQRFGFKPMILIGGLTVVISLALFPFWQALWFWFVLRVAIGIGDQMLHFGTQTWITTTTPKEIRGRRVAYYGMSFGLGFAIGPLMTRLLSIHESLPFFASAALSFLVWSTMLFVRNQWPQEDINSVKATSSFSRFADTLKLAWIALLPAFGYGFLEASLHSIFPIYGLRIGHEVGMLSLIIPCFAAGSLITQLPLGILSDKIGRRNTLLIVLICGTLCFVGAAVFETSVIALFLFFTLAGMLVGSLYSMGIAYMTDLLPIHLLPAGNLMISIAFSLGSIGGPFIGGIFVELFKEISFFYLIVMVLVVITAMISLKKSSLSNMSNS